MTCNKFSSSNYKAPHWPSEQSDSEEEGPDGDTVLVNRYAFTIRHLKQGATGAVKTWLAAEVLLDYLVLRGGLRSTQQKLVGTTSSSTRSILDLTSTPVQAIRQSPHHPAVCANNIVELGAGSGYLGVGLSLSLNREACRRYNAKSKRSFQPMVRVMCTDNDRATIKNMRHNIANQPRHNNVNKSVRVEPLGWGDDIGGDKFSKAVGLMFREAPTCTDNRETTEDGGDDEDPLMLLTHLVASDVHYGETTLDPLSSVIAATKLRNPDIIVVMLLRERAVDSVAILKLHIEEKVRIGLDLRSSQSTSIGDDTSGDPLHNFSVSVRDVLHEEASNMKMVEC